MYSCYQVFLFYPADAQLYCSKRMSKFTLKCSYMFRFNNRHQGATICALLKLQLLKKPVKIRRYGTSLYWCVCVAHCAQ